MTRNEVIIFLHIPKAAGSSLRKVIEKEIKANQISTLDLQVGEEFKLAGRFNAEELDKIRVFQGHMPFGLHREIYKPFTYITILRDPVERIISHYYFVLRNENHYLYREVTSKKMSLADYVMNKTTNELDNGQLRLISGDNMVDFGHCTEEMLDKAKYNLRHFFSIVGVSNRFDDVISLLRRHFGWKIKNYKKENVNERKAKSTIIPQEVLDLIMENNQLDYALYKYALELLDESLKNADS